MAMVLHYSQSNQQSMVRKFNTAMVYAVMDQAYTLQCPMGFNTGHIHHYDDDGTFLSCIVQGLYYPRGITFTADGHQLVVAGQSISEDISPWCDVIQHPFPYHHNGEICPLQDVIYTDNLIKHLEC